MGGKSKSSTSTSTAQTTTNTQNIATTSVGLDNTEFGVVGGGDVSVTQVTTDQGAVNAGKDVALSGLQTGRDVSKLALETNEAVTKAGLDTVGEVSGRAIDAIGDANDRSLDFGGKVVQDALGFGETALKSTATQTQQGFNTLGAAITQAANATRSDTAETLNNLTKYGTIAIAVIVGGGIIAAVFFKRG
jgi:hypothetical protein